MEDDGPVLALEAACIGDIQAMVMDFKSSTHSTASYPKAQKQSLCIRVLGCLHPTFPNSGFAVATCTRSNPFLNFRLPFDDAKTCTDVAREVVEVGSGVKNFKAGDKVTGGGLAEFAVAKETLTVPRPPEVSAAEGAGLPIAGLTAHMALTQSAGVKLDGSGPRKNILITSASGSVGQFAIQFVKLGNTHVTSTCWARNMDFVKSLGADEILDYKTPEGLSLKSLSGQKDDVVIHCTTGIPWSTFKPNLSANGNVIDLTLSPGALVSSLLKKLTFSKKQLVLLLLAAKGENLDYLVKLVNEGKLKTVIDSKYPLSKAEDAWANKIDGHCGALTGHATGTIIVGP
ncbi:oxidoreductase, zinc-binding dehydrogenase family protein [Actinidia rufa]|uniref:Oxidoreductase, zinc-binding dehydrogenase family protein n=1 Tax=Actinidia rufa TaxID=165716 RepID=A0A7J0FSH2_9ERIC|nr:oxidoreductase, zinc-binding dehydrogenase family protein [Actinidia rufa]